MYTHIRLINSDHRKDIERHSLGVSLEERQLSEFPKWFYSKVYYFIVVILVNNISKHH